MVNVFPIVKLPAVNLTCVLISCVNQLLSGPESLILESHRLIAHAPVDSNYDRSEISKISNFLFRHKWNASLILLRDYAELVSLFKVMFWKTHIPVMTQKWPPRLIFAGACHGIVINYVTALLLTMVSASNQRPVSRSSW